MRDLLKDCDVLLVGLGPVGAALSNLLGPFGIRVQVIDRATEIFQAPRAIALDNEALRVLQMCGVGLDDIDTVAIPEVRMHSPSFGLYSRAITAGAIDCLPKLVTFFQPQLEAVLRQKLQAYPSVRVNLGVSLEAFEQRDQQVVATVSDAAGLRQEIRARYIVGADGANSLVRRILGQDFEGTSYPEDWLVVDAKRVPMPIDHVEFICDPKRPTPHMVAPGGRQRWEFKLQPGETREQMERPEMVKKLLEPWTRGMEVEIERVAVYRFHARVAKSFQVGRAFLVGDAAHITPPFVGQGLVAGLRDVANLGWKLAWVVQGHAGAQLLDTYTLERQPHVKSMIGLAKLMGRLVMPSNRGVALMTHGFMKLLSGIPKLRDQFEQLEMKPANCFARGCFMRKSLRDKLRHGAQLPQVWLRGEATGGTPGLSDDLLGSALIMLGFGTSPEKHLAEADAQAWRRMGGRFVTILPCGHRTGEALEDYTGALIPSVVPAGWIATIRPDKTVLHDGHASQAPAILRDSMALMGLSASAL